MIKRRNFLQATLATAGVVIVGCGNETGDTTGGTTTTGTPRELSDGAELFPQSVASGDPKPDSVILWTRLFDEASEGKDLDLELELSTDAEFSVFISIDNQKSLPLKAEVAFDHCVKVRLAASPGTVYYYRFIYEKDGKFYVSRTGSTKTAPAKGSDTPVKFAYVSCQDYNGRFYNTYVKLAQLPLDFFVHLGDYVYETNGDPTFQSVDGRRVKFSDEKGAIELVAGGGEKYFAAKSLSNYRDLYRTYRSDPALQLMHEKFAMIATWDDHEFSDDCHGATASYFDGKKDETDVERRKAANQAWFEYMPVDYLDSPDFKYDPAKDFPGDLKIWRDFEFGKHVHLVMTDLRSLRADHIIPEDAYPGTVVVDEATLMTEFGEIPAIARPYVDIDDAKWSDYKTVLTQAVTAGGGNAAVVKGNISVLYINSVVTEAGAPLPIDDVMQMDLPRGVSYLDAGKLSLFSSVGSRYFTVKAGFDILCKIAYKTKKNQDVMGTDQEAWFLSTMTGSDKTWKIWGNEYCLTPLTIDLSTQAIPPQFQQVFYMNLDAWDGFRDKRSEIIEKLAALSNVVVITGDIHASFAATPGSNTDPAKKIVELVGSSVSSSPFKSLLTSQVAADPVLSKIPGAPSLALAIDALFKAAGVNPHLAFADSGQNGFVVVEVGATELLADYYRIKEEEVKNDHSGDSQAALDKLFTVVTFKTVAGGHDLLMKQDDGKFKKWNSATQMFE